MANQQPTWVKFVLLGLFAFALCMWVVFLAGVGASQNACVKVYKDIENAQNGNNRNVLEQQQSRKLLTRILLASPSETCNNLYGFGWWAVFYELICLVLGIVVTLSSGARDSIGFTVTALFIILQAPMMVTAEALNTVIFTYKDVQNSNADNVVSGAKAALAGNVTLTILNFFFIILSTTSVLGISGFGGAAGAAGDGVPPAANTTGSSVTARGMHKAPAAYEASPSHMPLAISPTTSSRADDGFKSVNVNVELPPVPENPPHTPSPYEKGTKP